MVLYASEVKENLERQPGAFKEFRTKEFSIAAYLFSKRIFELGQKSFFYCLKFLRVEGGVAICSSNSKDSFRSYCTKFTEI